MPHQDLILELHAMSRWVRNRPDIFDEAAAWICTFAGSVEGRAARRLDGSKVRPEVALTERLILHLRADLDRDAGPPTTGSEIGRRDALRDLLAAWFLTDDAHPCADEQSPIDHSPAGVWQLPRLEEEELLALRIKYPLEDDPRWIRRVRNAWDVAGEHDYLRRRGTVLLEELQACPTWMPNAPWLAYHSEKWARRTFPERFKDDRSVASRSVHKFVNDPSNECPAYKGRAAPLSYESWARNLREARRLHKVHSKNRRG